MLEDRASTHPAQRIIEPIYASKGWMKLLGIVSIMYGALLAITIIGLLLAWMPIWIGVLLMQSAKKAEVAYQVGDEADAIESLSKLKTMFTIYGVLTIISIAFTIVYFVVIIALFMGGGLGDFGELLT